MKTREQKLEEALKLIASSNLKDAYEAEVIAKKALEPEFVPEVGKLYMFSDEEAFTNPWVGLLQTIHNDKRLRTYDVNVSQCSSQCRPLTKQEWIDIGCHKFESDLAKEAMEILINFNRLNPLGSMLSPNLRKLSELGKKIKEVANEY